MKLKEGFITHQIQNTQMMVAAGEAAKHFHGLVRSNETAAFIVDCLNIMIKTNLLLRSTKDYGTIFFSAFDNTLQISAATAY